MRQPGDNPTIGLILCKGKDNLIVEYALRNNMSPISVANFETQLAKALPDNLKTTLPSVEEIEAELEKILHYIVEVNNENKTTPDFGRSENSSECFSRAD